MSKEELLLLLEDKDVQDKVISIIERELGDLAGIREYLDNQLNR